MNLVLWARADKCPRPGPHAPVPRRAYGVAMDPRWQPHLEHPVAPQGPSVQARELLAGGWRSTGAECRTQDASGEQTQLALETWRDLRELASCVRARTVLQVR